MQWFWHIPKIYQLGKRNDHEGTDSHAIVVVETTWLLRNLRKLRMETKTVNSWSGSACTSSSSWAWEAASRATKMKGHLVTHRSWVEWLAHKFSGLCNRSIGCRLWRCLYVLTAADVRYWMRVRRGYLTWVAFYLRLSAIFGEMAARYASSKID